MNSPAVLIVEDDANLREALLETLSDGDHPVFAAGSGPEALDILDAEDIGLVVSDLQMEPMDGHELLHEIRQQHPTLPAVLMTAYGSIENAVVEMQSGAADYLVKPFEVETLKAVVDRYLKARPTADRPVAVDQKTLRLLREREVERIGGRDIIPLDVRVLATTNRNLKADVADGRFREDLYYRLNVFPLHIPALRERPADILPLAEAAIRKYRVAAAPAPVLSPEAAALLASHSWPGNVRELENLMQRSLILLQGSVINPEDLVFEDAALLPVGRPSASGALQDDLKHREYQLIIDALRDVDGNRGRAASRLGISPRTLRYKLARMRDDGFIDADGNDIAGSAPASRGVPE